MTATPPPRSNVADLRDWNGFDPTFTNDMSSAIASWITQGMVAGVPLYAPVGTYAVDAVAGISVSVTGDVEFDLPRKAVFKSTANTANPIFNLSDAGGSHRYSLRFRGGTFDNALGVFVAEAQSNTCINIDRLIRPLFDDVRFKGAATYTAAQTTTDSGITGVDNLDVTITNSFFDGQGDACIYLGGNSSTANTDDGGDITIIGNHFSNSQQATAYKRQGARLNFAHNALRNMYSGINTLEVAAAPYDGGRQSIIAFNRAKFIETSFARFDGQSRFQVIGNQIVDFGYLPDGTTTSAIPQAIRILGASEVDISHNLIVLEEWTQGDKGSASHVGIDVNVYSYIGAGGATVNWTPDRVDYSDNTFQNITTAVKEESASVGPSFGANNRYVNVATKLSAQNASSQYREYDLSTGGERVFVGTTEVGRIGSSAAIFSPKFRTFLDTVGFQRIARTTASITFGTIGANSSAETTVTITGATLGTDECDLVAQAASAHPAGVILEAFVSATDTITARASNITTGSKTLGAATYTLTLKRIS